MNRVELKIESQLSVFSYQNARQFLLDSLAAKQRQNHQFSARSWAREMGLKAPSLLIMLLQGTRTIRLKHVEFLSKGLSLSTPELLYFRALVQLTNAQSDEERSLCQIWISELNPGQSYRIREIDEQAVVAKWIHMAIFSMTKLRNFKGTDTEIHKLLGGKVGLSEIRSALIRLEELELIAKNPKTGRIETTNTVVTTKDDIPSHAVRTHHRDILRLAEGALGAQSVLEREFQSFSVAIHEGKIPLAKELIRRFKEQFTRAVAAKDSTADHVYQVSLNFFRLTESPSIQLLENEGAEMQTGRTQSQSLTKEGNA